MPTPTRWNVPYLRNPFFTGREDVLAQLHRTLHADNTVALSHPQGISGLGGIGKTQTALEYAYRYRTDYDAVFWVRADSTTALTSSLIELANILKLPTRDEKDQDLIIQAVLRWFRLNTGWLLIYDNIDDLSIAEPFLPKAGDGHLLFTTRAHAFGGLALRLDIEKMEPDIGALLLLRRASIIALQSPLNMASPYDQSVAHAISQELDGLPLALDQAGAYIKEASCLLPDYLSLYQTRRLDMLQVRGSFDQGYPASVATTWSLSFVKVAQVNPVSAELLNFCAFVAPDAIPEEMITGGASYFGPFLQPVIADPMLFDQSIATLLAYSLVARNADNNVLSTHRLVQAVIQDTLKEEQRHIWAERVMLAVNTAFPHAEYGDWPQFERLLPHALVCTTWIEQERMIFPEAAHLLDQTGFCLVERARYVEAEPLLQRALMIRKQQLGPEHLDTAASLSHLARLYRMQGKYTETESLLQQALAIQEQQLSTEHPDIANTLHQLGYLYMNQGKYAQAEILYQKAVAIQEQQSGLAHLDMAGSLSNLGLVYRLQGKYVEAELFYRRGLAIWEQQMGPGHPDTATHLNNLGQLYQLQGKYMEAEPLLRQALAIGEHLLGPEHPNTATYLNNLGGLCLRMGKYTEAESLYQRALTTQEHLLGPEHTDVARSLNNLAYLYMSQGKYTEAASLYQRSLAIWKQRLGPGHPSVATTLNNLADVYNKQGKYEEAEPLLQQALAIQEQQFGSKHPNTAAILSTLGQVYHMQERYNEAELSYRQALAICKKLLGQEHPQTQKIRERFISFLQNTGRSTEVMQKVQESDDLTDIDQ